MMIQDYAGILPSKTGPVLEGRGGSNPGALKIFLKKYRGYFV